MHSLWADLTVPELGEPRLFRYGSGLSRGISALKPEWLLELLAEGCAESGYLMGAEETNGYSWRHDGGIERRLWGERVPGVLKKGKRMIEVVIACLLTPRSSTRELRAISGVWESSPEVEP